MWYTRKVASLCLPACISTIVFIHLLLLPKSSVLVDQEECLPCVNGRGHICTSACVRGSGGFGFQDRLVGEKKMSWNKTKMVGTVPPLVLCRWKLNHAKDKAAIYLRSHSSSFSASLSTFSSVSHIHSGVQGERRCQRGTACSSIRRYLF